MAGYAEGTPASSGVMVPVPVADGTPASSGIHTPVLNGPTRSGGNPPQSPSLPKGGVPVKASPAGPGGVKVGTVAGRDWGGSGDHMVHPHPGDTTSTRGGANVEGHRMMSHATDTGYASGAHRAFK